MLRSFIKESAEYKKRVIILATCIAFFVLMVSVVIGFVNKDAHSIVGGWETDTQMINSSSSDKSNSGKIQFFYIIGNSFL